MSYILTAVAIAVRLADRRIPETPVETTPALSATDPAETQFLVTRDGIELTDGVSWLHSSHIVYAEDWA